MCKVISLPIAVEPSRAEPRSAPTQLGSTTSMVQLGYHSTDDLANSGEGVADP